MIKKDTRSVTTRTAETQITGEIEEQKVEIEGYTTDSRHRQVELYIINELEFKIVLNESLQMNCSIIDVRVRILVGGQKCLVMTMYHFPSSTHGKFIDHFERHVDKHRGDKNAFYTKWFIKKK